MFDFLKATSLLENHLNDKHDMVKVIYEVKLNLILIYLKKNFSFNKNVTLVSVLGQYLFKEVTQNTNLLTSQYISRQYTEILPSLTVTTPLRKC